jgi:hypothetical protein
LLTLIGGTSGDLFGRHVVLLFGLVAVTLSNAVAMVTLGMPVFIYADLLNSLGTILTLPMTIAIVTLATEGRPCQANQ